VTDWRKIVFACPHLPTIQVLRRSAPDHCRILYSGETGNFGDLQRMMSLSSIDGFFLQSLGPVIMDIAYAKRYILTLEGFFYTFPPLLYLSKYN
jgi:hypothetical protein